MDQDVDYIRWHYLVKNGVMYGKFRVNYMVLECVYLYVGFIARYSLNTLHVIVLYHTWEFNIQTSKSKNKNEEITGERRAFKMALELNHRIIRNGYQHTFHIF